MNVKGDVFVKVETEKFDQWAIVDLFGHQRIAGKVTEQSIGGCSFVRVDVPDTDAGPGYTRLLGAGAIYSIVPTTEETARLVAEAHPSRPIDMFDMRHLLQKVEGARLTPQLPPAAATMGDPDDVPDEQESDLPY